MVPIRFRKQAEILLHEFDNRGNELTWNSDGVIFIDQVSIPESDIFILFPYLFKNKHPQTLKGFEDFYNKIESMGLEHLITTKPKQKAKSNLSSLSNNSSNSSQNWWFLD
jgi:hypothetical protein